MCQTWTFDGLQSPQEYPQLKGQGHHVPIVSLVKCHHYHQDLTVISVQCQLGHLSAKMKLLGPIQHQTGGRLLRKVRNKMLVFYKDI